MKKLNVIIFILMSMFTITSCKDKTINMATKPMTEQYIIGSMFKTIVEQNTEVKVDITEGVGGGTLNIHPSMESGFFDIYPEYTGTAWNAVLKKETNYKDEFFEELRAEYKNKNLVISEPLGFNNTYGLAVSKKIADEYNVKTFSDLANISDKLTFGAEYDFFEREDGYKLLQKEYGMDFGKTVDLDIGLKYDAIAQEKIDVVNVFTTDGRLEDSGVIVLEDDKEMYPSYKCVFIVRDEMLEKYPEVYGALVDIENIITDEDMARMNYEVEILGKDYEKVALNFLKENNLIR